MENVNNANVVLNQQLDLLNAFDASVGICRQKFQEVEKLVSKKFNAPTHKHSSLIREVLVLYSNCAAANGIVVEVDTEDLTDKLASAPKKSGKVIYLPGKLYKQLSSIVEAYSEAFGVFRDGLEMQAQQALAHRDALVRRIPLHQQMQMK